LFRIFAQSHGMNIGPSKETPIIPVIVGDSELAIRVTDLLFQERISVHPMFYPAVPMAEARLRFFISSEHTREDMIYALNTLSLTL
jgi:8-amino-7-oxononanoate synthase